MKKQANSPVDRHFTLPMKNWSLVLRGLRLFALAFTFVSILPTAFAQGTTAFTYQGQLRDGGTNANGNYVMVFKLNDAATAGNQVGPTATLPSQFVTNGQFNSSLDFGDVFDGSARWLEITVEGNVLTPRAPIAPVPYALHASTAATLSSSIWSASVGTFLEHDNVLGFTVDGELLLGLSPDGVFVNAGLEAEELQLGSTGGVRFGDEGLSIYGTDDGKLQINGDMVLDRKIIFTAADMSWAIDATSQGVFVDGINLSSMNGIVLPATDRNRAIKASPQGITVDDVIVGNARILLPSPGGDRTITGVSQGVEINSSLSVAGNISASGTVNGTAFNTISDRAAKENFLQVDGREVLAKVLALPIQTWAFKQDAEIRHMGPMAQDFHAAFGMGADEKHIATVDADGVALAAIQGLNEVVKEKDAEIMALKLRLENLEQAVSTLLEHQKGN